MSTAPAPQSQPTWCPACSREVAGPCHLFNCSIGPNGLTTLTRCQPGTESALKLGHRYTVGNQPCQNLKRGEGSFPGVSNVHQCPKCWGHRTFCTNCSTDHHDNGWETCKPNAYECAEEEQPLRGETM